MLLIVLLVSVGILAFRFQDLLSWAYCALKTQLDDAFANPKLVWLATKGELSGTSPVLHPAPHSAGYAGRTPSSTHACLPSHPHFAWRLAVSSAALFPASARHSAGFAASLISFICLMDGVEWMTSLGIWAVVTVDLVFESNIGTSLQ